MQGPQQVPTTLAIWPALQSGGAALQMTFERSQLSSNTQRLERQRTLAAMPLAEQALWMQSFAQVGGLSLLGAAAHVQQSSTSVQSSSFAHSAPPEDAGAPPSLVLAPPSPVLAPPSPVLVPPSLLPPLAGPPAFVWPAVEVAPAVSLPPNPASAPAVVVPVPAWLTPATLPPVAGLLSVPPPPCELEGLPAVVALPAAAPWFFSVVEQAANKPLKPTASHTTRAQRV